MAIKINNPGYCLLFVCLNNKSIVSRSNSHKRDESAFGNPTNSKNPLEKSKIKKEPSNRVLLFILCLKNQINTGNRTTPVNIIILFTTNSSKDYLFNIGIK